jgi:hypothetical protein
MSRHTIVSPATRIVTDPYLDLTAAMFRLALVELGVAWLRGPCAERWLTMTGLDFGAMFYGAAHRWPNDDEREPTDECPDCEKDWRRQRRLTGPTCN